MAIHNRYAVQTSLDLSEFMDFAQANTDVTDVESLAELGIQLSMLGNNRQFLSDFMEQYIIRNQNRDALEASVSQSVVIARNQDFYLRANFWLPEEDMTRSESLLFAYHQAHDHNFDLLSYAYCGSGYLTEIYEYDYGAVAGYVGEEVPLTPLGTHHHRCGDVLLYRCNKDIHFQRPPATPSITLNVIPLVNQAGLLDQYFFDISRADSQSGVLTKYAESNIEARRHLFNIVKHVATPKICRLLADIVESHACRRTRYEALRALKHCDPAAHGVLCLRLRDDPSPILQHYIAKETSR